MALTSKVGLKMNRFVAAAWMLVLVCGASIVVAQSVQQHRCAADAIVDAKKLLSFHVNSPDLPVVDVYVEPTVHTLAPIRNPASRDQILDVLEVWGSAYRGTFRMRLLYPRLKSTNICVLVAQEVLSYAKF
jgi:hypothetical protein